MSNLFSLIRHKATYLLGQCKYHFYDLKITLEYTGVISENYMSKYSRDVRVFWG